MTEPTTLDALTELLQFCYALGGVSESDIETIEKILDHRFAQLNDWYAALDLWDLAYENFVVYVAFQEDPQYAKDNFTDEVGPIGSAEQEMYMALAQKEVTYYLEALVQLAEMRRDES